MHDRSSGHRLLVVAHGTASPVGAATTARLVAAIRSARPHVDVELCFLDVVEPRLPGVLTDDPTVVLPLLLSTGFHVQADIPAAVAGREHTIVARHLGPDPALVGVLVDRLPAGDPATTTVLVAAGSSRPEARAEVDETATALAALIGGEVDVLTMADDLAAAFRAHPGPIRVATYLLAEGRFTDDLALAAAGVAAVSPPLGVHPALVELVWSRFDEAIDEHGARECRDLSVR